MNTAWVITVFVVALLVGGFAGYVTMVAFMKKFLREERYWCGCVRVAHWYRCALHGQLEHDEEPEVP